MVASIELITKAKSLLVLRYVMIEGLAFLALARVH
jgi:hypothetical protein